MILSYWVIIVWPEDLAIVLTDLECLLVHPPSEKGDWMPVPALIFEEVSHADSEERRAEKIVNSRKYLYFFNCILQFFQTHGPIRRLFRRYASIGSRRIQALYSRCYVLLYFKINKLSSTFFKFCYVFFKFTFSKKKNNNTYLNR